MKTAHDIIIKPIITEKSTNDAAFGKYTFAVDVNATNTVNYDGKNKRMGVHQGKTAAWKKAIVTIDQDPKSESFLTKGGKVSQSARKYKSSIEEFGFGQ
jgi:large subunit ribosomal protein L23